MPAKWYWAHAEKGFVEFENPQERTAFNIIKPVIEGAFGGGETCHVLVNVQKCNGIPYKPDLLFLKKDGAGAVDLKHYAGKISIKLEKRGNAEHPYCVDENGMLFSQGHGQHYSGEFAQVAGYSGVLKRLLQKECDLNDTHFKTYFGLCFTGVNAEFSLAEKFISENRRGPRLKIEQYTRLCLPEDLGDEIWAAAFGRMPPGKSPSEERMQKIIASLHCLPRDLTDRWIEINDKVYTQPCLLAGRKGTETAQDLQLAGGEVVSGRHLLIIRDKPGYVRLRDISTNGTYVNSAKLHHAELVLPLDAEKPIHLWFHGGAQLVLRSPCAPENRRTRAAS